MKTITEKKTYNSPRLEPVKLDNEISLILESAPPTGPEESAFAAPQHFNNDPFKSDIG